MRADARFVDMKKDIKKPDRKSIRKERALAARCVKNDKDAWDEFVEEYKGLIYNAILRTFHFAGYENEDEAEEVFQEVFSALLKNNCAKFKSFRWKNGCKLGSWLHVVAKNTAFDYLRKTFRRGRIIQFLGENTEDAPAGCRFEDSGEIGAAAKLEEGEKIGLFERAIKALPREDFFLLNLIYFRGIPHKNAAEILGKTVEAVYMHKKRVIGKIKKMIEGYMASC